MLSPNLARLRGQIGAAVLHSRYDSRDLTQAARAAFLGKFERLVDPEGVLPEAERLRRAGHAKRAHFAAMAYKSAKARAQRAARRPKQTAPADSVAGAVQEASRASGAASCA